MPKGNHGDRSAEPLPIEELVARHELEIEGFAEPDPAAAQYVPEDWQSPGAIEWRPPTPDAMPKNYEVELDAGTRMQAAAIAGGSFGAAGCFDDEILLRRANAIFNYIKSGLQ